MADENEDPPSAAAKMPRVRRRAPTIDLKATAVAVEPPPYAGGSPDPASEPESAVPPEYSTEPPAYETGTAPPPEPSPPSSDEAPRRSQPGRPLLEAGLAGGLVALVVFAVLWLGGLFSGAENPSDQRLAQVEAQLRDMASRPTPRNSEPRAIEELAARLERLEGAAPRTAANGAAAGAAIEGAIKPVQAAVADLARRVEGNAAAIRDARGQADAAVAAADAARVAAERNNVEALGNRVAALERASQTLTDEVAKSLAAAGDRPLRAVVAAQALRTAVERGEPFVAELSASKTAGVDPRALAPLEPFAANGLPSAVLLARQLSDLAPELLKATAAPAPAGGFLDRLQANAEKLVRIRPIDEAPGDEPAAVISRAQAKAARSDFTGALAELNALPANVRAPAEDWIKKVEARNAAINASRRVVADALAALGRASP
ncbi:MAG TPA: hypothetical protein VFK79_02260 [Xanthobacteraceae bacterium]|nr:hypothetical protein [Xanthobacteraceae bacterium]